MNGLLGELERVAYATLIGRVANFAFWALPFWDWAISLDREVEYIWTKPWGFGTFLYLWVHSWSPPRCNFTGAVPKNRYIPGAALTAITILYAHTDLNPAECMAFFIYEGCAGTLTLLVVKMIMTTRVYALWGSSKVILGILVFFLICVLASTTTIFVFHYLTLDIITSIGAIKFHACVPVKVAEYFFTLWFAPMAYEALCFFLALFKVYKSSRNNVRNASGRANFLEIIMRDSLTYFLGVTLAEVAIAVVWLVGPDTTIQAMVTFSWAIATVLCSRMILNLRENYYTGTGYTGGLELSAVMPNPQSETNETGVSALFGGLREKNEISRWNAVIVIGNPDNVEEFRPRPESSFPDIAITSSPTP